MNTWKTDIHFIADVRIHILFISIFAQNAD